MHDFGESGMLHLMPATALYSLTPKFHKVVWQQILRNVVDFIPASSAVHLSERITKIGPHLPSCHKKAA